MKLALCIIVPSIDNNDGLLRACASVVSSSGLPFCDFGIVIQTGPKPVFLPHAIIGDLPCYTYAQPWDYSFSKPRNFSLECAAMNGADYAFILDDDEVFQYAPRKTDETRDLLKPRHAFPLEAYTVPIYHVGANGDYLGGDIQPRIIPIHGDVRYRRRAHNLLTGPDGHPFEYFYTLPPPCHIRHFGYTDVGAPNRSKSERSMQLLNLDWAENPDGLTAYYIGREYLLREDWLRAEQWIDKAISMAQSEPARISGLYLHSALTIESEIKKLQQLERRVIQ